MAMANGKSNSSTFSLYPPSSSPTTPATKEKAPRTAARSSVEGESGKRARRAEWTHEDIDARAEEFIKRFKENLQLQRLQSIENYKEMLARGV